MRVCDLVKHFGHFRALDGLGLTMEVGNAHGFLGLNRTGRSTTVHVLLGLYRSDDGGVGVLARESWRQVTFISR